MTTAAQYRQHLTDGLTHDQAVAQIGCNAATARTLKSRYNNSDSSEKPNSSKPRKATNKIQQVDPGTVFFASPQATPATPPVVTAPRFDLQAARNAAVSLLFIGVVIGHAGLVWYDTGQMWGTPGVIGGAVTFAVVLAAVLLASDASKNRTSSSALWFVALIDAAAFFVHVPTFEKYADIGPIETRAFASFLCGCSFVALYLFRDSKLD